MEYFQRNGKPMFCLGHHAFGTQETDMEIPKELKNTCTFTGKIKNEVWFKDGNGSGSVRVVCLAPKTETRT